MSEAPESLDALMEELSVLLVKLETYGFMRDAGHAPKLMAVIGLIGDVGAVQKRIIVVLQAQRDSLLAAAKMTLAELVEDGECPDEACPVCRTTIGVTRAAIAACEESDDA